MSSDMMDRTAADICKTIRLSTAGERLLGDQTPGAFLGALTKEQLYTDAIRFMAATLPVRQAVWWTCLCIEHTHGDELAEGELAALLSAVDWVLVPSDANRETARLAAKEVGLGVAPGCAARAASFAGSSPDSNEPPVPIDEFYVAKTAAAGVVLAAAHAPAREIASNQVQFLSLGLDVSRGKLMWSDR